MAELACLRGARSVVALSSLVRVAFDLWLLVIFEDGLRLESSSVSASVVFCACALALTDLFAFLAFLALGERPVSFFFAERFNEDPLSY